MDLIHNLSDGSSICVDHSRGERLSAVCGGCGRLDAIRYLSSGGKGACSAADRGSTDISDIRSGSFGYLLVLPVSAFENRYKYIYIIYIVDKLHTHTHIDLLHKNEAMINLAISFSCPVQRFNASFNT